MHVLDDVAKPARSGNPGHVKVLFSTFVRSTLVHGAPPETICRLMAYDIALMTGDDKTLVMNGGGDMLRRLFALIESLEMTITRFPEYRAWLAYYLFIRNMHDVENKAAISLLGRARQDMARKLDVEMFPWNEVSLPFPRKHMSETPLKQLHSLPMIHRNSQSASRRIAETVAYIRHNMDKGVGAMDMFEGQ